jgi:predicted nucleic acid-binding protein
MEEKSLTIQELLSIEEEIASIDLEGFKVPVVGVAGVVNTAKICELYKKLRPVISIILSLPLIPQRIKDALRALLALLDQLCP